MRINQRGWTPMEDDPRWQEDDYYDQVKLECDVLAREWSRLHHEEEQEGFARQAEFEDGRWDHYDPEDEEAYKADEIYQNMQRRHKQMVLQDIDDQLRELGARMMRPYEHWHEDEALMEYMERDRGYY